MTANDNDLHIDTPDLSSDDDRLLEMFFSEARAEQLSDNGFSRRVMMRLPERQLKLSRWWTFLCTALAIVIFTAIGGWHRAASTIVTMLTTAPTREQLLQIMVCGAVLTVITACEMMRRERITLT
jgi:hypothetical protein